jgi:glycosyltransferase involved in cell wall biosynthesis
LIVSKELSPIKGSEAAVGWNIVTRLSKYHDLTVLYASGSQFNQKSYVNVIDNYFKNSPPFSGLTLVNIDYPKITKIISYFNSIFEKLSPVGLPVLFYIGYKYWQKAAFKEAKRLHKINNFNIVHQLTQITFREPGFLWKLGIPFFWGPTGGTATFPKEFNTILSVRSQILANIRRVSNAYQFNFTPRIIKANRKAAVIYTFSEIDAVRLKKRTNNQVKIMLDVGTYKRSENYKWALNNSNILKGIWCGRLDDYKAPLILLKALSKSQVTRERIEFQIIGSGPLERSLLKVAEELSLKNINWLRNVSHEEVFKLMRQADFFVHTSIQEATSSVILEALSMGLPVICHDAFGMSIAVNETCGIKIPLKSPEHSFNGFNKAMERLIIDKKFLYELKLGAIKRANEISWEIMAETIANDYLTLSYNN